ncbi:hypothetical protein [Streptosporangium sp. KLBMP 9127]|nr:hypothetical protein [Streptosporangium sp. KLBMP 9127]
MSDDERYIPTTAMRPPPQSTVPLGSPPPAGSPVLRLTPAIFGSALAVIVVMVLTLIFLLTRPAQVSEAQVVPTLAAPSTAAVPPPADPSVPAQPASTPSVAPTGPARFTEEAKPCELVSTELIDKLVRRQKQSQIYKEECEWSTIANLPDNMTHNLTVFVKVYPDDVAKAHEQLYAKRAEYNWHEAGIWPLQPAIGDDSYVTVNSLEGGRNQGPSKAIVGIRVSNALIEVTYDRRVPADPTGRLLQGATEVAKAVADKLTESG